MGEEMMMPSNSCNVLQTFYTRFPLPEFVLCIYALLSSAEMKMENIFQYQNNMQFVAISYSVPCYNRRKNSMRSMKMNFKIYSLHNAKARKKPATHTGNWQHCHFFIRSRLQYVIIIIYQPNAKDDRRTTRSWYTDIDNATMRPSSHSQRMIFCL